jgi:hypothetical protein
MLRAAAVGADLIVMPVAPVQEAVNTSLNMSLNTSLNTPDVQEVAVGGYSSYTQYQKRLSGSAPQFNSTGNGSLFSNGFGNSFGNGWNSANGSLLHSYHNTGNTYICTRSLYLSSMYERHCPRATIAVLLCRIIDNVYCHTLQYTAIA